MVYLLAILTVAFASAAGSLLYRKSLDRAKIEELRSRAGAWTRLAKLTPPYDWIRAVRAELEHRAELIAIVEERRCRTFNIMLEHDGSESARHDFENAERDKELQVEHFCDYYAVVHKVSEQNMRFGLILRGSDYRAFLVKSSWPHSAA